MTRWLPVTRTRTIEREVEVPVGGSGDVDAERLTYELPETVPAPSAAEHVGAAVLGEKQRAPVEDGRLLARLDGPETSPAPVESLSGSKVDHRETILVPAAQDAVSAVVGVRDGNVPAPGDRIEVVLNGLVYPDALVSSNGWSNPGGFSDRFSFTSATLSATSSGIGGTGGTQEETSGEIIVSFPDPALDDLAIVSATIEGFPSYQTEGTFLSAGSIQCQWWYGLEEEASTWRFWINQGGLTTGLHSLDITDEIGGDWNKVRGLRARVSGTVRSGTGLLPVTTTAHAYYARLRIVAERSYE